MGQIEDITNELKNAIHESDEYKEFRELSNIIERYPDIKRAVDDYRRENFFFQYSDDAGDVVAATEDLARRYEDVKKQPYVERYLRAEMCMCRLMQEICMELMNSVEFDTDFLYDEF